MEDALAALKQPVWVVINEVPLSQWGMNGSSILQT